MPIAKEKIEGKDGAIKRPLDAEDIKRIAEKQWGNSGKGGPKTEEGKKRALENLQMQSPKEIDIEKLPNRSNLSIKHLSALKVLNDNELSYYRETWEKYSEEFELGSSADEDQLHSIIMNQIILDRLTRVQLQQISQGDYDEKITDQIYKLSKVNAEVLDKLGATRKARLGAKSGLGENIASLIASFDETRIAELRGKKDVYEKEENELMAKKNVEYMRELEELQSSAERTTEEPEFDDGYDEYRQKEDEEVIAAPISAADATWKIIAGGNNG
jgi:hypothetical protein